MNSIKTNKLFVKTLWSFKMEAKVTPWQNMQKYQIPYEANKQQVENIKPGK